MEKRARIVITAFFVAVIVAPLIVGAFGYVPKDIENNGIADFPPITDAGVDPKFFDKLKEALIDHLPLREEMVRAGASIDMALFVHNYNPEVKAGSDGWLFFRSEVYDRCQDPASRLVDGVKALGDLLSRRGERFVFTIAPNKSAVYPEQLTTFLALANACPVHRRVEARRLLREQTGAYFVDTWAALLEAKAAGQHPLYRIYDTHWTPAGARFAAKALVDDLRPGLWDEQTLVRSPPKLMRGDLNYLEGLDLEEPVEEINIVRPSVIVTHAEPFPGVPRSHVFRANSLGPYLIPGRTVLLHDSFFERTLPMLPPYFEEIIFVHEHSREDPETIKLIAGADTFILALVERSVFGSGWFFHPDYLRRLKEAGGPRVARQGAHSSEFSH